MITVSNGITTKHVPTGFSWTTFFFGFFPALFRGDVKWAAIILIAALFTFGLAPIFIAFVYNRLHLEGLYDKGYRPVIGSQAGGV